MSSATRTKTSDPRREIFFRYNDELGKFNLDFVEVARKNLLGGYDLNRINFVEPTSRMGKSNLLKNGFSSNNCLFSNPEGNTSLYFLGREMLTFDGAITTQRLLGKALWWTLFQTLREQIKSGVPLALSDVGTYDISVPLLRLLTFLYNIDRLIAFETSFSSPTLLTPKFAVSLSRNSHKDKIEFPGDARFVAAGSLGSQSNLLSQNDKLTPKISIRKIKRFSDVISQPGGDTKFNLGSFGFKQDAKQMNSMQAEFASYRLVLIFDSAYNPTAELDQVAPLFHSSIENLITKSNLIREVESLRSHIRHRFRQRTTVMERAVAEFEKNQEVFASQKKNTREKLLSALSDLSTANEMLKMDMEYFEGNAFAPDGHKTVSTPLKASFSIAPRKGSPLVGFVELRNVLLRACRAQKAARKIKFELNWQPKGDIVVHVDQVSFETAVNELLENAFKYSKENETVEVDVLELDGDISITIVNRGPALTREENSRVPQFRSRSTAAIKSGVPGGGGGLVMARDTLVDLGLEVQYIPAVASKGSGRGTHEVKVLVPSELRRGND